MSTPATITVGALPIGFCPGGNEQLRLNTFMSVVQVLFPDIYAQFFISDTAPVDPADLGKVWIRLDANDAVKGIYRYSTVFNKWVRPHPLPTGFCTIAPSGITSADLTSWDGSDALAAGLCSGPMWEVDTRFDGKFPLGAGTLQPSATAVAVDDTGGVDTQAIVSANFPHFHGVGQTVVSDLPDVLLRNWTIPAVITSQGNDVTDPPLHPNGTLNVGDIGTTDALDSAATPTLMNIMNPYKVCLFIKRTTRLYYESNTD